MPETAQPLPLADATRMKQGEKVFTLGNPGAGESLLTLTPSAGILADPARVLKGRSYVQSNLSVNPGNSGGPLFNARGEVLGVITLKCALEGISLSVPTRELSEMLCECESTPTP